MRLSDSIFRLSFVGGLLCLSSLFLRHAVAGPALAVRFSPATVGWLAIADNESIAQHSFTLEFWMCARSSGIVASRDANDTTWGWWLSYDRQRRRILVRLRTRSLEQSFPSPDSLVPPGVWTHVALVLNGPDGFGSVYLNGRPVANFTFTGRHFNTGSGLAFGGTYPSMKVLPIDGEIAEIRYWSGERSAERLQRYYPVPLPAGERTGLVGYWRLFGSMADSSGLWNQLNAYGKVPLVAVPDLPADLGFDRGVIPAITPEGPTGFCAGGSIPLEAEAGFAHYFWSNGDTNRRISAKDSGQYCVLAIDVAGRAACSRLLRVDQFPLPPVPRLRISGDTLICATGEACQWYRNDTLLLGRNDSRIFLPTAYSGTYRVVVTNAHGCTSSAAYFCPRFPVAVQPAGRLILCQGSTVTLDAGQGYASYLWSDGGSSRTLSVKSGGSFRVIVGDSLGRRDTSAPVLVEYRLKPASPRFWVSHDTLRTDPGFTYRWMWNGTTLSDGNREYLPLRKPGQYALEITDAFGCRNSALFTLHGLSAISLFDESRIAAEPGSIRRIKLYLDSSSWLTAQNAGRFRAALAYDPRLLRPFGTGLGSVRRGAAMDTLAVEGNRSAGMLDGYLLDLPFEIVSSDTGAAMVRLTAFRWIDTLTVATLEATDCVIPLGKSSSEIPLDPSVRFFRNYPNPFNGQTTFEIELVEASYCRLSLFDRIGRNAGLLFEGMLERGRHHLACERAPIPDGLYVALLETPRGISRHSILLVRK